MPAEAVGTCVVSAEGDLFRGDLEALREAVRSERLRYHQGTIGGAWPSFPSVLNA
ncbi:MAG TPA: hypothetical protein VFS60_12725 [Thermoanaerobaculia bacterium]|nr:hypothetical protein [Thermoanaerobaculia bacterium]